jgi:hypothetical protein
MADELTLSGNDETALEQLSDKVEIDKPGVIEKEKVETKETKKEDKEVKFDVGDFTLDKVDAEETPKGSESYVASVKAKFPKVFDDFPGLRSSLFRAKLYSEVFPSIDVAREAAERLKVLDKVEDDIFEKGSTRELLTRIKKDDKAFKAITGNVLNDIRALSEDAYIDAIIPVLDELILGLYNAGLQRKDENLQNGALLVNFYVHGHTTLPNGVQRKSEPKKDDTLDRERKEFSTKKFNAAKERVLDKIDTTVNVNLEKMVSKDKIKIPFIRTQLIRAIKEETLRTLGEDDIHVRNMEKLWKNAERTDFDSDSLTRIIGTGLGKIAQILPGIKNRLELEAIGSVEEVKDKVDKDEDETPIKNVQEKKGKVDWSKTTDEEYLASLSRK